MADLLLPYRPIVTHPSTGLPLASGEVLFVQSGTMLPVDLFSDAAAETAMPNPVPLGATGLLPSVWYADDFAVDVVFYDADGGYAGRIQNIPRWSDVAAAASGVSIVPIDGIDATDVQAALEVLGADRAEGLAQTAEEQRTALGLGTAATRNFSSNADFGVSGGLIPTRTGVKDYHEANTAFTKKLVTSGIAIASNTSESVSHSLGGAPHLVLGWLVCTSAEADYSVGEMVEAMWNSTTAGTSRINTVQRGSATAVVRFADATSCFVTRHRTTGAPVALDNAKWTLTLLLAR